MSVLTDQALSAINASLFASTATQRPLEHMTETELEALVLLEHERNQHALWAGRAGGFFGILGAGKYLRP